MKRMISIFIILSIIFVGCSDDDNPVESNSELLKKEATDFSLDVINCYFTQDTTTFRSYLPEILYMVDPVEPPYETSLFILSYYLDAYDYSSYDLDTYKDTYDYYVLDYKEFSTEFYSWVSALDYWHPTNGDFLFFGYELNDGKTPFMNSKPLIFVVSKSSGDWKLKAIQ